MYAPFGNEVSPQMTMNDYKFAGLTRDLVTGLDQAMLRTYSSSINRWLTPDPARLSAVDPSNPQSWNAYAFTFDRPTTLTDPNGLTPCPAVYSSEMAWQGNGPAGPSGSGECDGTSNDPTGPGPVTIDANGDPLSPDIAEGEASYASNFGWQVQGSLYGRSYNQFFPSLDAYFNWRTNLAALTQNQAYRAYLLACKYATTACSGINDSVLISRTGVTINVQLPGNLANVAELESNGYQDPLDSFHNGNPSWYIGLLGLFGFGEGHVVADPNGIQDHYDDFGPLDPLHELIQVPLGVFKSPPVPITCSFVGGCQ
ncbi:MAG TPA: RHS repeat-associated core domain-containing protein [Terriglobia bacterium]|nr:RHS repeat-associated core domain-containing protein [Terriglobia bacterium]